MRARLRMRWRACSATLIAPGRSRSGRGRGSSSATIWYGSSPRRSSCSSAWRGQAESAVAGAQLPPHAPRRRARAAHVGARRHGPGDRRQAGGARSLAADARARGPGALLRDARQSAAPGRGARRIASHPVARRCGPGAPGGAPDRARRARSGAALAVPLELRDRLRGARPQGLTVLAYYSVAARQEFWTEHWGGHSVEELLAVARRSPLTGLITRALPADGVILEAGCGLGQYVLLLREQGWRVAGVDWSVEALAACRRVVPAPLAAMELRLPAITDACTAAYDT